jgi:1,2-dihydroxy-3-keto-5-methylthiopentene dioxygenase
LVRIQLGVGDFMIAPAGIYHRFILDEKNMITAVRMFNVRSSKDLPAL